MAQFPGKTIPGKLNHPGKFNQFPRTMKRSEPTSTALPETAVCGSMLSLPSLHCIRATRGL